jgi:hypothetical protein
MAISYPQIFCQVIPREAADVILQSWPAIHNSADLSMCSHQLGSAAFGKQSVQLIPRHTLPEHYKLVLQKIFVKKRV